MACADIYAVQRKMVDSLEALQTFNGANDSQSARRSELLAAAAERVLFVLIQREALKLGWDDRLLDDYGVPPEVRARLGTHQHKILPFTV